MRTLFPLLPALAAALQGAPVAPVPPQAVVVPHRAVPFDPAKENAIWCATFEMAWQAFGRDVLKGPLQLGAPAPQAFVEGMNAHPFPVDAVDAASCIALAGRKSDGILERIAKEGKAKFATDLPRKKIELESPNDLLAYAFLRKDLPFEHPFESVDGGIRFAGGDPIPAWGMNPGPRKGKGELLAQVRLLHRTPAEEDDFFVLEFTPKGGKDRILLALVPEASSLADIWKGVQERIQKGKPQGLGGSSTLKVPRIGIDLDREFKEIHGARVANEGFGSYRISGAAQSILFRLDEAGAVLESEGSLRATKGELKERRDIFVFDRPFLVALIQKDAKEPYFLAWIANGDLLAK